MDGFQRRYNQTTLDNGVVPLQLRTLGLHLSRIIFGVSIFFCLLVLIGYWFIRHYDRKHDRLSLRLLIYASAVHIAFGISGLFRPLSDPSSISASGCSAFMFFYVFFDMFSTFIITCISVNFQIIFVHEIHQRHYLERCYVITCAIFAFVLALIPAIGNRGYEFNSRLGSCWYTESRTSSVSLWAFFDLHLWVMLASAYSTVALVLVLWKIHQEEYRINMHLQSLSPQSNWHLFLSCIPWILFRPSAASHRRRPSFLSKVMARMNPYRTTTRYPSRSRIDAVTPQMSYFVKVATRVIWFPIVLIVTRIWSSISYLHALKTGKVSVFLMLMAYITVSLQGIFFFLIFLFDPSFHHAIHEYCANKRKQPSLIRSLKRLLALNTVHPTTTKPEEVNRQTGDFVQQESNRTTEPSVFLSRSSGIASTSDRDPVSLSSVITIPLPVHPHSFHSINGQYYTSNASPSLLESRPYPSCPSLYFSAATGTTTTTDNDNDTSCSSFRTYDFPDDVRTL